MSRTDSLSLLFWCLAVFVASAVAVCGPGLTSGESGANYAAGAVPIALCLAVVATLGRPPWPREFP